jgi:DNA repair exonuclease SbcCD nuclease subunit
VAEPKVESARILLVADTHLGFDLPFRPRIERRRRGQDFFSNFEKALEPARRGAVDLVVHGGDLLYRSRVPAALVEMAMAPLAAVAEGGVPVYIVPGNHERSRIPLHLWAGHPNIHIFDRPRTYICQVGARSVALSGFPFHRDARDRLANLVAETGHSDAAADAHLLCIHAIVEGAQVGVGNYTFRSGPDVVRGRDIPAGFAAVLSGHIHRAQVLTQDLGGRALAAPVIYPGSIERTSIAERDEEKGFVIVRVPLSGGQGARAPDVSFVPLPARPMVNLVVPIGGHTGESLVEHLKKEIQALDPDAVVRVQLKGADGGEVREAVSAARLREMAPPSMNIWLAAEGFAPQRTRRAQREEDRK